MAKNPYGLVAIPKTTAKARAGKYAPGKYAPGTPGAALAKLPAAKRAKAIEAFKALDIPLTGKKNTWENDLGGLIGGLAGLGKRAVVGTAEDAARGRGLPGAVAWAVSAGHTPGPFDYKKLPKAEREAETTKIGREMIKGIPQSLADIKDVQKWKEDPILQAINAVSWVLPPARAASVAKLSKSIKAANPGMSVADSVKAGTVESLHPGFMGAHGVKGGIPVRTIGGVKGRMPSRQPTIRGALKALDQASAKLEDVRPGMKYSTSQRAARMQQRNAAAATRRADAARKLDEQKLLEGIVGTKGTKAKLRKVFDRPGKTPPSIGAALVASLQGPAGATVREASELGAKGLRSVLVQHEQIQKMVDRVDALQGQLDEAVEAGLDPPKGIQGQIKEAQRRVDQSLGKVAPVGGTSRQNIYQAMVDSVGKKRANQTIILWDKAARGLAPNDPEGWYDRVEAKVTTVDEFVPEGAQPALFQRMAADQGGWYFPIARALEAMPEQRMQIGQLISTLRKQGISSEELRNSQLLDIPKEGLSTVVTPQQLLGELDQGGYFRTFDPDVTVTRYDPTADPNSGYSTRYHVDALNSRDIDADTEYYEMTVRYPEMMGTRSGETHWGQTGNVYHVRFQVFTDEDGYRIMLIDEIQSDWASDYRKAKKEDAHERTPEETVAERAEHEARVTAAGEDLAESQQRQRELVAGLQELLDEGLGLPEVLARNPNLQGHLGTVGAEIMAADSRLRNAEAGLLEFESWVGSRVPLSPMGPNRYAQNAVRQILRHADDNDIDGVVLVDGHTQALRNQAIELGPDQDVTTQAGRTETVGRQRLQYGEWIDDQTVEPIPNERITELLREQGTAGSFTRLYNEEFPKIFKAVAGAEGRYLDDAYTGRYSAQPEQYDYQGYDGYVQPEEGAMPGTVFQMTPEVKAKIREDQPLYMMGDEGRPLGATEFLANGKRRVTMFETARVDTWVHELAHVAIGDLDPADLAVLEREIAGGKSYAEWGKVEQEKFARSFETYLRDGWAEPVLREVFAKITKWMREIWKQVGDEAEQISPETAEVFDRMLGRQYQNSVVLKPHEVSQVRAQIKDLQDALDSGDVDRLDEAADALAEMSKQAEEAGVNILLRDARSPEHAEAILAGLSVRKNAIVEDYRRRGLVGKGEEARGYFPHVSMWEAMGMPKVEPSRVGAVTDVVGKTKVSSKVLAKKRNKLIRYQTGEVLNDPVAVTYVLKGRLRVLETLKGRDELWEDGTPIKRGEPFSGELMYLRAPRQTPKKIRAATLAAQQLSTEDFKRLAARRRTEEIDEGLGDVEDALEETVWTPNAGFGRRDKRPPEWVESEEGVRVIPRSVATTRLGDVFQSAPKGKLMTGLGVANSLFRIASIYLPFWRYIPVNYAQNAVMLALTNPAAFNKLFTAQFRAISKRDPQLGHMIREQVGTIQATALPEYNIRAQTRGQKAEQALNRASGQAGEVLGKAADVPIRSNLWLRHAEKYGFSTDAELRRLIESTDPAVENVRDIVSQRVKEDLIDFDTLTPWEKEVATRMLALWPFIRGITKWPLMYAREYPARLGVANMLGQAYQDPNLSGSQADQEMVDLFGKTVNLGKFDPSLPGREMVQALFATVRANGGVLHGEQPNLKPLAGEYGAPQIKEMLGIVTGEGRTNWLDSVMKTFVPGWAPYAKTKQGGSIATQIARQGSLIKEVGAKTREDVNEWIAPADEIAEQMRAAGQEPPPQVVIAQSLRAPYGDWKMYESTIKYARRDQGKSDQLSGEERIQGLTALSKRYYPALYAEAQATAKASGWESMEAMIASGKASEEYLDKLDRYMYDQMFGVMNDVKRDAKEAGWKVEK